MSALIAATLLLTLAVILAVEAALGMLDTWDQD